MAGFKFRILSYIGIIMVAVLLLSCALPGRPEIASHIETFRTPVAFSNDEEILGVAKDYWRLARESGSENLSSVVADPSDTFWENCRNYDKKAEQTTRNDSPTFGKSVEFGADGEETSSKKVLPRLGLEGFADSILRVRLEMTDVTRVRSNMNEAVIRVNWLHPKDRDVPRHDTFLLQRFGDKWKLILLDHGNVCTETVKRFGVG